MCITVFLLHLHFSSTGVHILVNSTLCLYFPLCILSLFLPSVFPAFVYPPFIYPPFVYPPFIYPPFVCPPLICPPFVCPTFCLSSVCLYHSSLKLLMSIIFLRLIELIVFLVHFYNKLPVFVNNTTLTNIT